MSVSIYSKFIVWLNNVVIISWVESNNVRIHFMYAVGSFSDALFCLDMTLLDQKLLFMARLLNPNK